MGGPTNGHARLGYRRRPMQRACHVPGPAPGHCCAAARAERHSTARVTHIGSKGTSLRLGEPSALAPHARTRRCACPLTWRRRVQRAGRAVVAAVERGRHAAAPAAAARLALAGLVQEVELQLKAQPQGKAVPLLGPLQHPSQRCAAGRAGVGTREMTMLPLAMPRQPGQDGTRLSNSLESRLEARRRPAAPRTPGASMCQEAGRPAKEEARWLRRACGACGCVRLAPPKPRAARQATQQPTCAGAAAPRLVWRLLAHRHQRNGVAGHPGQRVGGCRAGGAWSLVASCWACHDRSSAKWRACWQSHPRRTYPCGCSPSTNCMRTAAH